MIILKLDTAKFYNLDQLVIVDSDVEYIIDILRNDQDVEICEVDYTPSSIDFHGACVNRDMLSFANQQCKLAEKLGASKWVITKNNIKYIINIIN